jgi:hypothetical protein
MSTELVQISPIPPFHQSTQLLTSCPRFYVEAVIKKRRKPSGLEAARGTQVHRVLAQYAAWCSHKSVPMDLDAFDNFAKAVGPTAANILAGLREGYVVDFAHLLGTEVGMRLDENFHPTHVDGPLEGMAEDSGLNVVYEGTPDALYTFRDEGKVLIDDAKTHSRPFDPNDPNYALQGQMYSLFVMQFFPWVNEVTFRLWFVRYKNLSRQAVYTRDDLRKLMDTVRTARSLQVSIHDDYNSGKEIEAIGNDGCFYCPLLSNRECPILQDNPNAQGDPSEWLSTSLVYSAYARVNNARMKAWVQANGKNIILRDFNNKCYSYGPVEKESSVYPLFRKTENGISMDAQGNPEMPIVSLLMDYAHASPDDTKWMGNLVISSTKLNSYLGTKRRAFLDQAVTDSADKVTKATLKVSKPLDSIDEEPEDTEDSWDEDEEF